MLPWNLEHWNQMTLNDVPALKAYHAMKRKNKDAESIVDMLKLTRAKKN